MTIAVFLRPYTVAVSVAVCAVVTGITVQNIFVEVAPAMIVEFGLGTVRFGLSLVTLTVVSLLIVVWSVIVAVLLMDEITEVGLKRTNSLARVRLKSRLNLAEPRLEQLDKILSWWN